MPGRMTCAGSNFSLNQCRCFLGCNLLRLLAFPTGWNSSSSFQFVLGTSEHRTLTPSVDWNTPPQSSDGFLCHFCLITQHIVLLELILFQPLPGCQVKGIIFHAYLDMLQVQCLVRSRSSLYISLKKDGITGWVRDHASAPASIVS